jgi:RNA polymerase sigma-70 factor (ECF subfamily)
MGGSPTTQPSLLVRLADARDGQAWAQFVEIYAPLVYGHARKAGLQDADAADLTQEVLRAVAGAVGRLDYDPRRGSFRGWLFTVVRNTLRNFLAGQKRHCRGSGDTSALAWLEAQPARDGEQSAQWDQEYEQRLFTWAAEQVRGGFHDSTWQAFWQTAVEGKSAKDVGQALGMSAGAVYVAKSRVLARLTEQIRQIQEP